MSLLSPVPDRYWGDYMSNVIDYDYDYLLAV